MKHKKEKLYLVKREVYAKSLRGALAGKGSIYEVTLADEKFQPEEPKKEMGFNKIK